MRRPFVRQTPRSQDVVEYELTGWEAPVRDKVEGELSRVGIDHDWQGSTLRVLAKSTWSVDQLLDQVESEHPFRETEPAKLKLPRDFVGLPPVEAVETVRMHVLGGCGLSVPIGQQVNVVLA